MQNWAKSWRGQQGHLNDSPQLPAQGVFRDLPGGPQAGGGDEKLAAVYQKAVGPENGQPLSRCRQSRAGPERGAERGGRE